MNRFITIIIVLMLFSCASNKNKQTTISAASNLIIHLKNISSNGILLGQQDVWIHSLNELKEKDDCDFMQVCGQYPALFGWEIGDIENDVNIDGVPFDSIVSFIKQVDRKGGINALSWHENNPVTGYNAWTLNEANVGSLLPGGTHHHLFMEKLDKLALFLHRLTTDQGEPIPIIIKPWHDMNGGWFWWGINSCTNDEYIALFRFTVKYLREEKACNNLLVVYSPCGENEFISSYMERYPGDEVVDILGMSNYNDFTNNRLDNIVNALTYVVNLANEKNKLAAFTETGNNQLTIDNWFTSNLLQVLKANEKTRSIAYVMIWKNKNHSYYHIPHKGHAQANDFVDFTNDKMIFLLNDYIATKKH